ncbi:MAG TPA: hypothetical protein DCE41_21580 [Cytophagales bacterium]|nr:hypothetical protein [Cytophagales bacterium]HAA18325.1 hypothetical protein [Cytophagales bacterium]HAP59585.1 hypothetical protein [Cytophagales bacterium]
MKKSTTLVWLGLFLLDAVLHLVSTQIEGQLFNQVTKALLMPLLIVYAITKKSIIAPRLKRSLVIALLFSWVGDILLALPVSGYFIPGLAAFLVGHVVYIVAYGYASATYPLKVIWHRWWYSLPIVGYGFSFIAWLLPKLPSGLEIPVVLYALVITVMLLAAAGRGKYTHPTSFIFVLLGAVFFALSDSMIAINRFVNPLEQGSLLIMSTYILGQWLITEGLLRHPSPAE